MSSRWLSERRLDVPQPPREPRGRWLFAFDPVPLARPTLVLGFADMSFLLRLPVAVAHVVLRLEYAMSPGGQLRAWLLLNLRLLTVGLVLVLCVLPLIYWFLIQGTVFVASATALADAVAGFFKSALMALVYFCLFLGSIGLLILLSRTYGKERR